MSQKTLTYRQQGSDTATEDSEPAKPVKKQLLAGRYQVLKRLGAGGFGEVWAAEDLKLKRKVAVKRVRTGDVDRSRLSREARAAARVNHPAVVALYETFELADSVYFVSELVEGRTLAELIADGSLSDREVASIGYSIAAALNAAHSSEVVHRDVKPENILVPNEQEGLESSAKLVDFGVAHLANDIDLTRTGDVIGTVAYMSPEQAEGERVSTATDSYSLALTLYEAFTGLNPLRKDNPAATVRAISKGVQSLTELRPDLPTELAEAIDGALVSDPELRTEMQQLATTLKRSITTVDDQPYGESRSTDFAATGSLARLAYLVASATVTALTVTLAIDFFELGSPWNSTTLVVLLTVLLTLLPRYFWPLSVAGLALLLATTESALLGSAALIATSGGLTVLLLLRSPKLWPVAMAAPLLSLIGLAPLFPAVGVFINGWLKRAALGVAGGIWLLTVQILTGSGPYLTADVVASGSIYSSLRAMFTDGIYPLAASGAVAVVLIWGIATVLVRYILKPKTATTALVLACCWSVALFTASAAVNSVALSKAQLANTELTPTVTFVSVTLIVMLTALLRTKLKRSIEPSIPTSVA